MKIFIRIIVILLFSQIFMPSCRKRREGKLYTMNLQFNSSGHQFSFRLKVVNFTKTELKVTNTNLSYRPEYVFKIDKEKITGTIIEIDNSMNNCPQTDTILYELSGTISRKKMSGTFRFTSTCYPNSNSTPDGTFEMDLTKPVD